MAPKRRLPPARWRRSRPPSVRRTEAERAIDLAYKAVARRDLTVAELRTRLERKHVPPEAIDEAVAELEETGFLDDARYARQFAEDKRELEHWGKDRIARDLRRRGIAPQLIDVAVSTHDRDSELRTALLLLKERYKDAPRDDRDRDRAWQMLVRRGYSPDLAYDAIRIWERAERERRRAA
jgi:regulatory protein